MTSGMSETNIKVSVFCASQGQASCRSKRAIAKQPWNCFVQMLVHGSDDFPDDTAIEKALPVGRELLFRVTPTSGYCTQAVRKLPPSARQCVFESEMKLRYFPVYSEINCIAECRMNYTIRFCNCSHFYYHDTGKCGSVHDSAMAHFCSAHVVSLFLTTVLVTILSCLATFGP
jgi:hypothetical protein